MAGKSDSSKKDEFLARLPGFLEMLGTLATSGFFEEMHVHVNATDGVLASVSFIGRGFVPSKPAYMFPGIKFLVNPVDVLRELERQIVADTLLVRSVNSEAKSTGWDLWNRAGEKVIGKGKKGTEVNFNFTVVFNTES